MMISMHSGTQKIQHVSVMGLTHLRKVKICIGNLKCLKLEEFMLAKFGLNLKEKF